MKKEKILVTVKTYPLLSTSHTETVCTAGIRKDGSWIRLYPIPYRLIDKEQKFKKYQWIEVNTIKDNRDPRPESHKIAGNMNCLIALIPVIAGKAGRGMF